MLRTITLCSGKGGVGKTLLSTSLARIIQREENCKVLLVDLDLSVSGLTLLAYHNKIELDRVPLSLVEYLSCDPDDENALFATLQKGLAMNGEEGAGVFSLRHLSRKAHRIGGTHAENDHVV